MSLMVQPKSKCHIAYDRCPTCRSIDVKGPFDTALKAPYMNFKRAWFCRAYWWSTELELYDDVALAARDRELKAAAAKDRAAHGS